MLFRSHHYRQVKIYFIDWNILTRTRLTPEDVKRMNHVYLEVNEGAAVSNIANSISSKVFKDHDGTKPEEARMVIELVSKNGKLVLFYANKAHLLNSSSTRCSEIDQDFIAALNPFSLNQIGRAHV